MLAKFELNGNAQPVFKKKHNVPFASLEQINEELDRLVKTGVLAKLQYSDWTAPTVYVKKKSKEIRVFINIYISNILSASEDNWCGLFVYRVYEEFHIHIYQTLRSGRIWHKVNFLSGF